MGACVLVVDDDAESNRSICEALRTEAYTPVPCLEGRQAVQKFLDVRPDLVILDVLMSGMDGLNICAAIRRVATTPVIFVSARGSPSDIAIGLRLGADDYIAKPFDVDEMLARVGAVLRRAQGAQSASVQPTAGRLQFGPLTIDPGSRQAFVHGAPLPLTPIEFKLLAHLAQDVGRPFSREQLLAAVWANGIDGTSRTVDVHVRRVRKKLDAFGVPQQWINTVRGMGYAFNPNGSEAASGA